MTRSSIHSAAARHSLDSWWTATTPASSGHPATPADGAHLPPPLDTNAGEATTGTQEWGGADQHRPAAQHTAGSDVWEAPAGWPPAGETHDPAMAELRNQVIDRLRRMNASHSIHAWDRRNSDPLAPYGIALFYRDTVRAEPPWYELRTATRLFLDGPETRSLAVMLDSLARIASDKIARSCEQRRGWDPRVGIANRSEPMTNSVEYVGIGVSSLDSADLPWHAASQAAASALELSGVGYALLADGTALLIERASYKSSRASSIYASKTLDVQPGMGTRFWHRAPYLASQGDATTRAIWQRLWNLYHVIQSGVRRAAR